MFDIRWAHLLIGISSGPDKMFDLEGILVLKG